MSEQPKALWLADQLEAAYPNICSGLAPASAAELRRLYALCEEQQDIVKFIERHCAFTVKTNSKDVRDWIDDVAFIGKTAVESLAKWKESK